MTIVRALLLLTLIFPSVSARGQERIALVPHSDEAYGIESVVPEGWTAVGMGIHARQSDETDTTLIAQQSAPLPAEELLTSLLPQLGLTEAPESVGAHDGVALSWTLYEAETAGIAVDLALAEEGNTTYLVVLQSSPDEQEELYASVFLPALDAFAPLEIVEEPVPYEVEEVTFENGDVTLAGTLTLPPTEGRHPAIVLVSGSGPQDRDESLGAGIAIRPFRLLADALTREGVAVLRYDDRGVGASTGTFSTATVSDFAADAEAALAFLSARDDADPDRLGLLGHSEGGLVAAMLGARNDDLDFIIALAGPGVSGREVLALQNRRILEAEGASEEDIERQQAFMEEALGLLDDPEALEELTYERALEQLQLLPDDQRARIPDLEAYARQVARQTAEQYSAEWFESFLNSDPAPDWAQTTVPVLAIFGGKDVQVDAEQNAPALETALEQAGNENFEIVVLPDANHLFQVAETGSPTEYATLPAEFTPELIPTIVEWLEGQGIITE
jgi:pimeloyl-ACP methyl ester carboxylesterase